MKVGDLVKFSGTTCDSIGDPGVGTVIQYLAGGSGRKNPSAEVHWPKINMVKWHVDDARLEVISESR
tara:strand:+ start:1125 stop:1325 length:201 start_codon:yes stop_codon:yes gene_type:complete